MSRDRIIDQYDTEEATRAAFAEPASAQGQLIPYATPSTISVTDGIITAQKVAIKRDLKEVRLNLKELASMAGDDWYYSFPARNADGSRGVIEGPTIKCANSVAREFGNCQIDTRVVDLGDSWIIYARFVDYQTGFSYTRPFQQRKGQKSLNTKDAGRALDIAIQIGVSKAIRNVITNALETFTTFAVIEAKKNIVEKVGKNLAEFRNRVLAKLDEIKVPLARVEAQAGRAAKDWIAPDVARIISQLQAIADGMATPDDIWPAEAPPEPTRADVRETLAKDQPKPDASPEPSQAKPEAKKSRAEKKQPPVPEPETHSEGSVLPEEVIEQTLDLGEPGEEPEAEEDPYVNVTKGGDAWWIVGVPTGEILIETKDAEEFVRLLLAEAGTPQVQHTEGMLSNLWRANDSQFTFLKDRFPKHWAALREGWPRKSKAQ